MSYNILIVDDVELSREVLKNAVNKTSLKLNIHTAINAFDALEKMINSTYDLVIMDIIMPDGDGFELLAMMSARKFYPKVIIISSLDKTIVTSVSMLGQLYSLDIVACLEKPIIADNISLLVQKALTKDRVAEPASKDKPCHDDEAYPITLAYQPQVISNLNVIVGFEVLPQWSDTNGAILPSNFYLPLIETFNNEKVFTDVVIKKFIKDYNKYFLEVDKSIRFAINIDPNLLLDEDVVGLLLNIYESGFKHSLVIELIEKSLNQKNEEKLLANILRLTSKGFEISIDGLGMESSNIKRISNLPINEVKIDKYLTWSLSGNQRSIVFIDEVKKLSSLKNARVVFKGVESLVLKDALESIDCYHHQGFFYGVPVLPEIALAQYDLSVSRTVTV